MRLPRDLSGIDLVKSLRSFGYEIARQTGSHIRLTTQRHGEHRVTIPNHSSLKIGTLGAILSDVATHAGITRDELLKELFGI